MAELESKGEKDDEAKEGFNVNLKETVKRVDDAFYKKKHSIISRIVVSIQTIQDELRFHSRTECN